MSARGVGKFLALACVCALLSGCRHRVRAYVPRHPSAPVELLEIPEPSLPRIAAVPDSTANVPVASAVARELARMRRRPVVKPVAAPPVATPAATVSGLAAIGELSQGGEASAHRRQQAVEMLAAIDKRLARISANVATTKAGSIAQVRDFERKARVALDSGDAEGAVTLATKATLLLNDLLK